jgi:hypothetical protein
MTKFTLLGLAAILSTAIVAPVPAQHIGNVRRACERCAALEWWNTTHDDWPSRMIPD